jgi:hypothetical protein
MDCFVEPDRDHRVAASPRNDGSLLSGVPAGGILRPARKQKLDDPRAAAASIDSLAIDEKFETVIGDRRISGYR